jgi:hypothetical protein
MECSVLGAAVVFGAKGFWLGPDGVPYFLDLCEMGRNANPGGNFLGAILALLLRLPPATPPPVRGSNAVWLAARPF